MLCTRYSEWEPNPIYFSDDESITAIEVYAGGSIRGMAVTTNLNDYGLFGTSEDVLYRVEGRGLSRIDYVTDDESRWLKMIQFQFEDCD